MLNLGQEKVLPQHLAIIGVAGGAFTRESVRKSLTAEIPQFAPDPIDLKMWDWLVERIYFVPGDFANPHTYKRLQAQMEAVNKTHGCDGNNFFYLAVAPRFFSTIVPQLCSAGITKEEKSKKGRL